MGGAVGGVAGAPVGGVGEAGVGRLSDADGGVGGASAPGAGGGTVGGTGFGLVATAGGSEGLSPVKGASQSANCSGSMARYAIPPTRSSKKIQSSGRPPLDFFPGFIAEAGRVAVVWSSSSSVNSKSGSGWRAINTSKLSDRTLSYHHPPGESIFPLNMPDSRSARLRGRARKHLVFPAAAAEHRQAFTPEFVGQEECVRHIGDRCRRRQVDGF